MSVMVAVLCVEVEGIQGAGPKIFIWGAGSPKSPEVIILLPSLPSVQSLHLH
jgi:hypothetical protein